jgi:hypothetical protein
MKPQRLIRKELVESLASGSTAWDSEVRRFGVRRQRIGMRPGGSA